MRIKNNLPLIAIFTVITSMVVFSACKSETDGAAAVTENYSFIEEFDTLADVYSRGWIGINRSNPLGTTTWNQGTQYAGKGGKNAQLLYYFTTNEGKFSGFDFIAADYTSGSRTSTISNWMISPPIKMKNGDKFSFLTRTAVDTTASADRMEVRISATGTNATIPYTATAVGDFTNKVLDINPNLVGIYAMGGYPGLWTKYTVTVSGLPPTYVERRIAFRYFVPDGGPEGANSFVVGLDKFEFTTTQ
jgi:hypothetical protein